MKLLMFTTITNNWSNCTMFCMKKGRIIGKDMTSWFSSTTTHHRTRQQWSKTTWRYSTGKCYPISLTHQTWHLLTITCFCRWATRSLSGTLILREDVRKWLDEWFASKDEKFFWHGIHKLPEKWEKCIVSEGKYFEQICFCFLGKKKCVFLTKKQRI